MSYIACALIILATVTKAKHARHDVCWSVKAGVTVAVLHDGVIGELKGVGEGQNYRTWKSKQLDRFHIL